MKNRIYLDNNATTAVDSRVVEAILCELSSAPSNPSSSHYFGQQAKLRLQQARETIAHFLKATPQEIIFTSGGTESMNLLLRGFFQKHPIGHVITSNIEHSCVYNTLMSLQQSRLNITFLSTGLLGAVTPEEVKKAIRSNTSLIVLSAVNSETGIKNDINAIAQIASEAHIPFIVDGVALLGKEPFSLSSGISAMGFSAHKLHGPKGAGFIFLKSSLTLHPLFTGGDQELSRRAGTENLPGIIGLAKAIEILSSELPRATHRMALLRDRLENGLLIQAAPVIVNGMGPRIANTCNLSFPDVNGEDLLIALDMAGIAVSHGSACTSGAMEPSRVLLHMGIPYPIARCALRFSLSRYTTEAEIDQCIETVSRIVKHLRRS